MSEEQKKTKKIIIQGVTKGGKTFRPSDWAERMSGNLSTFRKHRLHYSPLLYPGTHNGYRCVLLDERLRESNPRLYQSILNFARDNNLRICDDNNNKDDSETEKRQ